MKKKLFFLWALLLSVIGANAQAWTWTGETAAAGTFYIKSVEYGTYLNTSNGMDTDPNTLWTLTASGSNWDISSNGKHISMTRSGSIVNYKYTNNTGADNGTVKLSSSSTCAGAYLITGTYANRYLNTSSSSAIVTNGTATSDATTTAWYFISKAQMDARVAYISAYNTLSACSGEKLISLVLKNRIAQALEDNASASYSDAAAKTTALTNLKTEFDNYISSLSSATKEQGKDVTGIIKNHSFETANGDGWAYVKGVANGWSAHNLYGGKDGNKCAEAYHEAFTISQSLTGLPNGYYGLTAQGFYRQDDGATETVPYFFADDEKSNIPVLSGAENSMDDASASFTNGLYTCEPISVTVKNGTLTIGAKSESAISQWCIFDNFQLTYYGPLTLDEAYEALAAALEECKPWDDKSYDTYTTVKAAYEGKSYTTEDQINTAISQLRAAYDTFRWDNASMEHPYLVEGIISRADCADNTPWTGSGRTTATGQHWSGDAGRVYFTQNHEDGAARSQNVTIPSVGVYMLKTSVRIVGNGGYATISVDDETETTTGPVQTTGGTIATDGTEYASVSEGKAAGATFANNNNGYGWVYNKITFATTTANEQKTISISLSNANNGRESDCGGMFLYYVGNKGTLTEEGDVISAMGNFNNQAITAKANTTTIDLTNASGSFTIDATANPNVLVYTKGANVSGVTNNVVSNGTCANLVLTDGHPFKAIKNFEATSASYNMTAVVTKTDGKTFGTLILPFAATTMPAGNKVYVLDQGVNFGEEIHATEGAIAANAPVLVTKAGDYTASNVAVAATNDTHTNGQLVGTYKAMTALENTYVLQNHSGRIAFFMVKNVKPTVNPFRAYIKAQSAGARDFLNVVFDDETGVDVVNESTSQQGNQIYDLAGRRINNAVKGIYIINGKKVIK